METQRQPRPDPGAGQLHARARAWRSANRQTALETLGIGPATGPCERIEAVLKPVNILDTYIQHFEGLPSAESD